MDGSSNDASLRRLTAAELRRQIEDMEESFINQGILDRDLLRRLEVLQREEDPDFVERKITTYLKDSLELLDCVRQELKKDFVHFPDITMLLKALREFNIGIGAIKIVGKINKAKDFSEAMDMEGFKVAFRQLQEEHASATAKLESYLELLRQQACPTSPPMSPA